MVVLCCVILKVFVGRLFLCLVLCDYIIDYFVLDMCNLCIWLKMLFGGLFGNVKVD